MEKYTSDKSSSTKTAEQELVVTRTFDAPREMVWKAWTDPEQVKQWWGPKDFTAPFARIDLRKGGTYLFSMRSPDGNDYWSTGVFREVVPPERLVSTDSFSDEKGNVVSPEDYGMSPDFPSEMQVTTTFEEQNGKTTLTLRYDTHPSGEDRENMMAGWNESLDKLADFLRKQKEKSS